MKPLCFVLMPFGIKTDGNKKEIDFDIVYKTFIREAIIQAGLEPIRADEEKSGGFIHKPMYERLMFCDFSVADLSFANANVFYELGIRHALKPHTTVSIFEVNTKLPFDTAPLRTFPYNYENGAVVDVKEKIAALSGLIKANLNVQKALSDSPISQLITDYKFPDLQYLQSDADAFREWVTATKASKSDLKKIVDDWQDLSEQMKKADDGKKKELEAKQQELVNQIKKVETDAGDSLSYNYDLLHALLDSYKSVNAFNEVTTMLRPLVENSLSNNTLLKQQLALAYNKTKNRKASEEILKSIIEKYGPDPETSGLLGAVYKGKMDDNGEDKFEVRRNRKAAIEAYLQGFESDPRNYYPGVNALTLLFLGDEADDRFKKFLPLVSYAVERQLKNKASDYWLKATALELAALDMNSNNAEEYLAQALDSAPKEWERKSTAGNLKKIYNKARELKPQEDLSWLEDIIKRLEK